MNIPQLLKEGTWLSNGGWPYQLHVRGNRSIRFCMFPSEPLLIEFYEGEDLVWNATMSSVTDIPTVPDWPEFVTTRERLFAKIQEYWKRNGFLSRIVFSGHLLDVRMNGFPTFWLDGDEFKEPFPEAIMEWLNND